MSTIETPAFPKVDIVIVGYEVGDFVPLDYELTRQMLKLGRNFPIRVVASHSCYSDGPMQKVVDMVVHMITPFLRLRFRIHNGALSPIVLFVAWGVQTFYPLLSML
jgi:hypothetical protein